MPEDNQPPVSGTDEVTQFVLATRMLIKMGIPFDDPRLKNAINQLSIWPQLLFDLRTNDEGKPDVVALVDEAGHSVDFRFFLDTVPEGEELVKRAVALVEWCQKLLGEDWSVVIQNRKSKGGKYRVIYQGNRLKSVEARVATLTDASFPEPVTNFKRYRTDKLEKFKPDYPLDLGPILPTIKR